MTSVSGAGGAGGIQAKYEPIKDSEMNSSLSHHVKGVQESFAERVADLQEQISNADNPQQKMALEQELMKMESAFKDFSSEIREMNNDIVKGQALGVGINHDNVHDAVQDLVTEFRAEISASYAEFGTACVSGDTIEETGDCGLIDEESIGGDTDAASPDEMELSASSDDMLDPGELLEMMENDPQAFAAHMGEMGAEERGAMMMAVQNELQQINQLFSMMTQFSQAMHDTSKAVIQNLRV